MKTNLALLLWAISFMAFGGNESWIVNSDHSQLNFSLSYLGQGEVQGHFKNFKAALDLVDEKPTRVLVRIKADSIDTGSRMRDSHLRSSDFLRARLHPEITFNGSQITLLEKSRYQARGELVIGGISRPTTIIFELSKPVKDTWGFFSRFAKFSGLINRNDFAIKWNKTLTDNKYLVGEEITLSGNFQLQPASSLTPSNKHMIPDTPYIRSREKLNRGELEVKALPEVPRNQSEPVIAKPVIKATEVKEIQKPAEKDVLWWIAFSCLGMLGFVSSVIIGIYSKEYFTQRYAGRYSETGLLGHISDFVSIIFVVIYGVSLWQVGWG